MRFHDFLHDGQPKARMPVVATPPAIGAVEALEYPTLILHRYARAVSATEISTQPRRSIPVTETVPSGGGAPRHWTVDS